MKKILIIGGGSIGQRHLRNLLFLGEKNLSLVEVNTERANDLKKEFGIEVFSSTATARKAGNFDIVFVCTPPACHLENALLFAASGAHLFIEKPLSNDMGGVAKLVKITKKNKLVTMVGSNWKFYPSFQKIKELIDSGAIGRVLSARCQLGQYLPDWHPKEDYRHSYSANKKLGGGMLLDSHEFGYLSWFLGDVKKVACFAKKVSALEIDVEDVFEAILEFTSGAIGEIHADYLQRFYQRNFEFFGETGTIIWDYNLKKVILKNKANGITEFPLEENYDLNAMYVEEIKHFLQCVEKQQETVTPIEEGAAVLRLICAAKDSAEKNKVIKL